MNVTTLLVPLFAVVALADRIVAPGTPYVRLRYGEVLALSAAYQGGVWSGSRSGRCTVRASLTRTLQASAPSARRTSLSLRSNRSSISPCSGQRRASETEADRASWHRGCMLALEADADDCAVGGTTAEHPVFIESRGAVPTWSRRPRSSRRGTGIFADMPDGGRDSIGAIDGPMFPDIPEHIRLGAAAGAEGAGATVRRDQAARCSPVMMSSTSWIDADPRVEVVRDDGAATHHHHAVHHLEDVVDVVGDEDAGVAAVPRLAHEAQHALRLRDAEVVGRFVEDDEVAVEVHCAGDGDRLPLAAPRANRWAWWAGSSWRCRRGAEDPRPRCSSAPGP